MLTYRFNTIQNLLGSYLAPGAGYYVTVLEPGGVASANSTGATISLHEGHGFEVGDKIIIAGDDTTFDASDTVQSRTTTQIVMGSSYSVFFGDAIINLGADTSATDGMPNWDAGRTLYNDPTGTSAKASSTLTCNSQGEYDYYIATTDAWEVVRVAKTVADVNAVQDVLKGIPSDGQSKMTFGGDAVLGGVSLSGLKRRDHVWDLLRSAYDDVGIFLRDDHDRDHYIFLKRLDTYRWWGQEFFNILQGSGSTTCNALMLHHIYKAFLSLPHDDVTVTESGTWTAGGSNASAYNTTYRASVTTNDYVEWTAPANSTDLAIRTVCATNGGLAKVTIGGSATAANKLLTAQDLVDSGEYPNTILVAFAGTLNPTDRVLDFSAAAARVTNYADTLEYDVFIPIATDLAAAAHVVRLTVTGYKHADSTDYKVYSSGYMSRIATTKMDDANVAPVPVEGVMSVPRFKDSAEYAISFLPAGGTNESFIGNRAHGYDQQTALAIRMDGSTITPTQDTLTLGTVLEVTRTTELRHPDYGGGTTKVADVLVLYRMTRDGLSVSTEMTWAIDVSVGTSYKAMMSVQRTLLDKGSGGNFTTDSTFSGSDANPGSTSDGTNILYAWDSNGNLAAAIYVPDTTVTCNDFPMITHKAFWVDYSTSEYAKAYFSRSRGGQYRETVTAGTIHRGTFWVRVAYVANANRLLARS